MTNEETIKTIEIAKADVEWNYPMEYQIAFDIAIECIKKQIPTKPKHINKNGAFDGNWIKVCPSCGMKFVERVTTNDVSYPGIYHIGKYCDCGQAIDWRDNE